MRRCELLALALLIGCQRHESAPPAQQDHSPPPNLVPHTTGPIAIDGEWNEPDWAQRALRGQFLGDDGQLARPSSEVRFLRDDRDLIVALYAADEDIETRDAFDFTIGKLTMRVDATGAITPANPQIRARVDYDEGTRDNPKDDDEEWVVELAIPLAAIQLDATHRAPVAASRCDTPKDHVQRCGRWTSSVTVD